jgi:hypothetical protein
LHQYAEHCRLRRFLPVYEDIDAGTGDFIP